MSELAQKENNIMAFGGKAKTNKQDDHVLHVLVHKRLLQDPRHKNKLEFMKLVQKHVDEHIEYLKTLYWENNP